MPRFRLALPLFAAIAILSTPADAQVGGTGYQQLTCNTNVTVTPAVRTEGLTETTGDITITCTGGVPLAPGSQVPLINLSIFYNSTVTSRLLPVTSPQSSTRTSEALLLIDEPQSGLPGYGPSLPQMLCTTPLTGCPATVGAIDGPTLGKAVSSGSTPAPNAYQGVVNGNSVTFFGVPVLPPGTVGSRVFRIMNVRINGAPLHGQTSFYGAAAVSASIVISGATSLAIQNSTPYVAFGSDGLAAYAGNAPNLSQCTAQTKGAVNLLTFTENFGTAFKTRVQATANTLYNGQINNPSQNIPGAIYNSESGFVFPVAGNQKAGLTDFGTRLKAAFNNVPPGVRIFVSTSNVHNAALPVPTPSVAGGSLANLSTQSGYVGYAQLVTGEGVNDGNAAVGGIFPAVSATDFAGSVPIAEVPIVNGSGSAVWEVVNTNPNTNESFKFAVYATYAAGTPSTTPPPFGTTTVTQSFASTDPNNNAADSSTPQPRFTNAFSPATPLFTLQPCTTCASTIQPVSIASLAPVASSNNLVAVTATPGCGWTATSVAPWLAITQGAFGSGNGTVEFSAQANSGSLLRTAPLTIAGQTLNVNQRPPGLQLTNAANIGFIPEHTVSPGEIITLNAPVTIGPNASEYAQYDSGFLPQELAGTRVLFDGAPAFLLYVSQNSVTAIVPQAVAGRTSTLVEVEYNGVRLDYTQPAVAAVTPGLVLQGPPQVYLLPDYFSEYSVENPGAVVTAIFTGAGITSPIVTEGKVYSPTEALPAIVQPVSVTVGGIPAQVLSATVAPVGRAWAAGAYAVRFVIPPNTLAGNTVPFTATIGGTPVPAYATMRVTATPCSYSVSFPAGPVLASGGTASVPVTTQPGCYWSAATNVNWVTITSGSSATGSGQVNITVAPLHSQQARSATFTIAGQTFTLLQTPPVPGACLTLPSSTVWYQSVDYVSAANTADDRLLVGTLPMDKYTQGIPTIPLPQFPDQRICGSIPIAPGILANAFVPTSAERLGDFSPFAGILLDPLTAQQVNGVTVMTPFPGGIVPVNRLPAPLPWRISSYTSCSVNLGLTGDSSAIASAGATRSLTLSADNSTCGWAATSAASWITFPSGNTGLGTQNLTYTAAANPLTTPRSADIVAAGQHFTVTQQGAIVLGVTKTHTGSVTQGQSGVTYTIIVTNLAASLSTSGAVTVVDTLPAGMTLVSMSGFNWTCVNTTCTRSDALASGASYSGITVTVNLASNLVSPSTNVVTVSGGGAAAVTVSDPTIIGCVYSLAGQGAFGSTAGSSSISVSTTSTCTWSGATTASWLHITSGATGTGAGQLNFNLDANLSNTQRTGDFSIAGQTFTIIQGGGLPVSGSGLRYVPVTPCRIADTRFGSGQYGAPSLAAATARDFDIRGSACGIPANAQAYSLNLTVVPIGPLGFLSVWPAGQAQPVVSTLNSADGRVKANAAIVPAGTSGAITLFGSQATNVIIDISGYFVPAVGNSDLAFYPLTPCRVADTRLGSGSFGAPALTGGVARTFPMLSSACGIPSNARAYALNMTAVPTGPLGFLSAWPAGQAQPGSSTLNAPTGAVTANAAIVPAGVNGAITLITTNTTNVVIDINGYFAPPGNPGGMQFYTVTPCRIVDTRFSSGPFGGPQLPAAASRSFVVTASNCGVPGNAGAFSLNATVVPPAALGFLSLWGAGGQPTVSTLNAGDGSVVANAALVPAASNGGVSAFASNLTHLILDINGYFAQ